MSTTKPPPPPCRLLALPGELRNRIYRFVSTLKETPIIVTDAGFARPGIMSTCKEIRTGTIEIYYVENKFTIHMVNLSSDSIVAFDQSMIHVTSGYGTTRDFFTVSLRSGFHRLGAGRSWPNHLETMRRVHAGEIHMRSLHPSDVYDAGSDLNNPASLLMHNMATLANLLTKEPWDVVEKIMLDQRAIMNSAAFTFDEQ